MVNATGSGPAWKSHSLQDKFFRALRAPAVFPWASPDPAHGPGPHVSPVPAPAALWDGGPQLPTALPSHRAHRGRPTHRPMSWPSLSPVPSQGGPQCPGLRLPPVPSGWGDGTDPGCQAPLLQGAPVAPGEPPAHRNSLALPSPWQKYYSWHIPPAQKWQANNSQQSMAVLQHCQADSWFSNVKMISTYMWQWEVAGFQGRSVTTRTCAGFPLTLAAPGSRKQSSYGHVSSCNSSRMLLIISNLGNNMNPR